MGGPMDNPTYLRRQALFCLRLAQLCPDDPPLAEHLRRKAAEYHEKALRTEFEYDRDEHDWGTRSSERYQPLSQRATS
jgi:hypothetical protein